MKSDCHCGAMCSSGTDPEKHAGDFAATGLQICNLSQNSTFIAAETRVCKNLQGILKDSAKILR